MKHTFLSIKHRKNGKLALFTFCFAFIVILLGAFTRLTNAGLSCPDWPNCFGFITAPHTLRQIGTAMLRYPFMVVNPTKAWTEMVHRYFAGTEGLLILALVFILLFKKKPRTREAVIAASALTLLLAVQISLGMLTVTAKLKPVIVLSHLLTGISILGTLWWTYLDVFFEGELDEHPISFNMTPLLWIGFVIVACQITLGGWVSTHYAALACIDFPYCNGKILPAMHWSLFNSDLITIHMMHRIGAFLTASYILILSVLMLRQRALKHIAHALLTLLCMQIALGILNIVWLLPVKIALVHQAVAILLLLTLITALVKTNLMKRKVT